MSNVNLQMALKHHQAGNLALAGQAYRQLLSQQPNNTEALHYLGVLAGQQGDNESAIELIKKAISIKPSGPMYLNLGNALQKSNMPNEAIHSYRKAISLIPNFFEAHNLLGNILLTQNKLHDASESFRKAASIKPDSTEVLYNLGNTLRLQGKLDEAIKSYQQALLIKPDFAEAAYHIGNAFRLQGNLNEAINSYRKAISIRENFPEAHCNLGGVLELFGKSDDAISSLKTALFFRPDYDDAHNKLAASYMAQGKLDEAEAHYKKSISLRQDYSITNSNLLFMYSYHSLKHPEEYLAISREWELACVPALERQEASRRTFARTGLATRKLRVGYVSGDYCRHAISYFVEQLFSNHDRSIIELFAYSTRNYQDNVTLRLRDKVDHWFKEGLNK